MLNPLLSLFGRSPFAPLERHMEEVSTCVYLLKDLFDALDKKNYPLVEEIATKIGKQEHQADITKNDIRNHLPKRIFLPIERSSLLEILALQDSIADRVEDAAVLTTLKQLEILPAFREDFFIFLEKNIETFNIARKIVKELHELLETTFGGIEADKVRKMVDQVSFHEHETDVVQLKLLKGFMKCDDAMHFSSFYIWQRIFEALSSISNYSENLADRVRLTLELK